MRIFLYCAALGAWLPAAAIAATQTNPIRLTDMTRQTGISFVHTDGSGGQRYMVEVVASGLALFDYNNDGRIDIFFLNGTPLKGTPAPAKPPRNALYRNDGDWKFTDVTEESGLGEPGFGLGVATGDYDNDGYPDLYISNFGPNKLYHNNGDGTFTDVTKKAGVEDNSVGAGVNWLDIDGDGDLDLFVARYVDFTYERHVPGATNGYPTYSGPRPYPRLPNALFRNNGDGTFTDMSRESGIAAHPGAGMGTVCGDFDNDGDIDIFVANDTYENFLFLNDGKGKFTENGLAAGVACNLNGDVMGNMGVACGDYNNDGWLDLFVTDYQQQSAMLFKNLGGGAFEDVSLQAGAGAGSMNNVKWGCGFADFDNDGWRDIFVAVGHLQDNVELWDDRSSYRACNVLLRNLGNGRFVDVSAEAGDGMKVKLSSRGAGFDDLDNDGRVDAVVLNARSEPTILRNETPHPGRWLQVALRGKKNRFGVGVRVRVVAGDLTRIDEIRSGQGYQSDWGQRLYFGLGSCDKIDRIEVRWPGGTEVYAAAVDRLAILEEGKGRPVGK
jgi:enediyne biosynthesis protein E4